MAIFRFGGGCEGIGDYLKYGKKAGREYTRDDLDERVRLSGSLEVTESIIANMTNAPDVERYDHITFAFKEHDITDEMLKDINDDIREFLTSAYGEGEIDYYAEAHRPKILEYPSLNDEEPIKRGIHIHIVIPKINLVTRERASALEMLNAKYGAKRETWEYVDAFQTALNHKYGLEDPKDNLRIKGAGKAEVINRSKTTKTPTFFQSGIDLRDNILRAVVDRNITTQEDFTALLAEYGEVKTSASYYSVKLEGEEKSHRLKDNCFKPDFIALPTEEKRRLLFDEGKHEYLEAGEPREPTEEQLSMIEEFKNLRSKEIRFISTNSNFYKDHYRHLSTEERMEVLHRLEHGDVMRDNEFIAAPTSTRFNMIDAEQLRANMESGEKLIQGDRFAIEEAIDFLTRTQSSFSRFDLEKYMLDRVDLSRDDEYNMAVKNIMSSPYFVVLDEKFTEDKTIKERYTSRKVFDIEQAMIKNMREIKDQPVQAIDLTGFDTRSGKYDLNAGQKAALISVCDGKRIAPINGAAGSGKSTLINKIKEAKEADGCKLYGMSLQGKTAVDLQNGTNIISSTIHSFLGKVDSGKIRLDEKSVFVIDEAGQVSSELFGRLLQLSNDYGCQIIPIGDIYQTQAVGFGSPFEVITKEVEADSLTEIIRQKVKWQNDASVAFSTHKMKEGLDAYNEHGNIVFHDEQLDCIDLIAKEIRDNRKAGKTESSIVITATNKERIELNRVIRNDLIEDGIVHGEQSFIESPIEAKDGSGRITGMRKVELAEGDQVMFTGKNTYDKEIKNGTIGKVTGVDERNISFEVDGRHVSVPREAELKCELGYAVSVHKSQGVTVDTSMVLMSKNMSANLLYVAMTRHQQDVKLFASHEHFKDVDAIAKGLKADQKDYTGYDTETDLNDDVVDRLLAESDMEAVIERDAVKQKQLKAEIDLPRLLTRLQNEIGLDAELYGVVKDGNKIQCGKEQLDPVKFLTKKLGMDYKTEALPFLQETYKEQLQNVYVERKESPNVRERQEFAQWFQQREANHKDDLARLAEAARDEKNAARALDDDKMVQDIQTRLEADRKSLEKAHKTPNRVLFDEFRATDEQKVKRAQASKEITTEDRREEAAPATATPTAVKLTPKEKQHEQRNRNIEAGQIPPPHLRNRVLDLSSRDVVLNLGRDELPLLEDVHGRVVGGEAKPDPELQRADRRDTSGSGQKGKGGGKSIEPKRDDLLDLTQPAQETTSAPEKSKAEQMLADLKAKRDAESKDLTQADVEKAKAAPPIPVHRRKKKYENDFDM